MNAHLIRAEMLMGQSRVDMAEKELRQSLAADPNEARAHALLGLCLSEQERFKEATQHAEQSIALAPDEGFSHYALGCVLSERDRPAEAEKALREAVRLEPEEPQFLGILASVFGQQERWREALAAAEEGLRIDPDDVNCINVRALALNHLGRKDEAVATTAAALAHDPENALTHTSHGWTLLRQNQHEKAMEHFREALRLDSELDWARAGILEALKARHFVYRLALQYFFWMSTLSSRARWGVIIGLYIVFRIVRNVIRSNPETGPYLWPVVGLYMAFVMLTWTAQPLFTLLLRLNRFGRLALSREEIMGSNLVGGSILGLIVFVVAGLVTGVSHWFMGSLTCWLLIIPLSATFSCDKGWPRTVMAGYTAALAVAGFAGMVLLVVLGKAEEGQLGQGLFVVRTLCIAGLIIGGIAAAWVGNALASVTPKR
jgi:tetratricopeptide (TPR) repeat protein